MSVLRIYAPLGEAPQRCQWALIGARGSTQGESALAGLPRGAARVQLVVPAAQVLLTRASLPPGARRRDGALLAFAVEDATAAEPDTNQVSWLGAVGDSNAFAVLDRHGLALWREALEAAGVHEFEVHAETLLLPREEGEWSLAWNGAEGFVRSGALEGAATDGGDAAMPPLSLRMLLEQARPEAIALYMVAPGPAPDLPAWQKALGIPLRSAGAWDWRTAPAQQAGTGLAQERRRWRMSPAALAKLRPAAWIAAAALALHAAFLLADWALLAAEQRALRGQMEARFRGAFPEAVAVADPALQMRRQLALARHRAGIADGGDFAPMMEKVALALKGLPAGALRSLAYEGGRMSLELAPLEAAALEGAMARLARAGLAVERAGTRLTVRAL